MRLGVKVQEFKTVAVKGSGVRGLSVWALLSLFRSLEWKASNIEALQ